MNAAIIQSLPSSSRDAARLASRLGIPVHEIAIHGFPDGEIRVTAGPAAPTTIIYASLDRPNEKLIALLFAAEALRRGGAKRLILLAPYLCYMRQDAAFHEGEAISQKVVGALIAGCVDRVITVDAHLHRTPDIGAVFPGIEADNLSAMPAIADALRKTGLDPATIVIGPDAESQPWVSDLAGRLGLSSYRRAKDPTRRPFRRNRISGPGTHCRPSRPDRGRYRLLGRHHDRLRQGAGGGRRDNDRRRRHPRAVPGRACRDMIRSGIRSIRSTHSVPHSTNAILLDNLFVDALQDEVTFATLPETSR